MRGEGFEGTTGGKEARGGAERTGKGLSVDDVAVSAEVAFVSYKDPRVSALFASSAVWKRSLSTVVADSEVAVGRSEELRLFFWPILCKETLPETSGLPP